MLIRHAEEFAVLLAGAESQLDGSDETIRFEGQSVFHVTLRIESGRNRLLVASGARPARTALAAGFRQRSDARSVLTAAGAGRTAEVSDARTRVLVAGAQFIQRGATRLTSLPHSGLGQVVDLINDNVPNSNVNLHSHEYFLLPKN